MLTVILGAGASYDAAPKNASEGAKASVFRLPLTKQLFDAERIWCQHESPAVVIPNSISTASFTPVLERIRREAAQRSLEHALQALKAEIPEFPERWRHVLAVQEWIAKVISMCTHRWIQELRESTTLVDLVARLDVWRRRANSAINFTTFNYDTLLERAVSEVTLKPFNDFADYLRPEYSVLKPHGSTGWWWDRRPPDFE